MKLSAASSSIVVCLGQMLYPNQTLPSSLMSRIEKTFDVTSSIDKTFEVGRPEISMDLSELIVIFSGSDTAQCGITEAVAMEQIYMHMIDQNPVRSIISNIIKEEKSHNTIENALYCRDIIHGLNSSGGSRSNIILVTSDYHMPRAKILFECICGSNCNDDNDDDVMNITVTSCPSDSLHKRFIADRDGVLFHYRPREDRQDDSNEWTLNERLDWEYNALLNINSCLAKYGVKPINEDIITKAIQQLQAMNYTNDGNMTGLT